MSDKVPNKHIYRRLSLY